MNAAMRRTGLAAVAALALAGCTPEVETVTVTAEPEPATQADETAPAPQSADDDLDEIFLSVAFDGMSSAEQRDVCDALDLFGARETTRIMNESLGDEPITVDVVEDVLGERCAA